jgi:hypothetical protein
MLTVPRSSQPRASRDKRHLVGLGCLVIVVFAQLGWGSFPSHAVVLRCRTTRPLIVLMHYQYAPRAFNLIGWLH